MELLILQKNLYKGSRKIHDLTLFERNKSSKCKWEEIVSSNGKIISISYVSSIKLRLLLGLLSKILSSPILECLLHPKVGNGIGLCCLLLKEPSKCEPSVVVVWLEEVHKIEDLEYSKTRRLKKCTNL